MENLEHLIRHESENTYLDFKAIQYEKSKFEAFLKDVMSFANALGDETRHIIVGVKYKPGGQRDIIGIDQDDFIDGAIYNQLVYENIEPDLRIDYSPFQIDGKTVGVFTISAPTDKPYMMMKKYGSLEKGAAWVRKGESNSPMTRQDFDAIIDEKAQQSSFDQFVSIGFEAEGIPSEISLPVTVLGDLPSEKARQEISRILAEKREEEKKREQEQNKRPSASGILPDGFEIPSRSGMPNIDMSIARSLSSVQGLPYKHRTIDELERTLKKVKELYRKDDLHTIHELKSHRVNFIASNASNSYIKDASVIITFTGENIPFIADQIYDQPSKSNSSLLTAMPEPPSFGYPLVERSDERVIVKEEIGDIRHYIPKVVFRKPLRVALPPDFEGSTIDLTVTLHGENIKHPIVRSLEIVVTSAK